MLRSVIVTIAVAVGCAGPVPGSADAEPDAATYHRDIAPILALHCVECHRSGGIAPFPLTTHAEVAPLAAAIAAATAERTMPPFILDNSGACNTYEGARWLDDREIELLDAWARAGAPAGPPRSEPPASPPAWALGRVDRTLEMPEPYTPDGSIEDDYRCFILDPGLGEDAFVTGFEVRPGRPEMVHHWTLFALDSADDEQDAAALDAVDDGPGYRCFGDTIVPSRWLVGAGPSDRGSLLPEGTGLRMRAGRKTVLQMHYNRRHGAAPDRTAIDLRLEPSVAREASIKRIADTDLDLPPGESAVSETDTVQVDDEFTVWGVWPHMHDLGAALRVTAIRPGSETCLAQVDRYAFHWQQFAFYEDPIRVRAGDTLRITCTYDTTSRDTPTTWGEGTADEMCIGFFYVTRGALDPGP